MEVKIKEGSKKLKLVVVALAVLLLASVAYIVADKVNGLQMQQLQDVKQAAEQGYDKGVIDALAAAYQQTANCQVTTITLGNVTRSIIDVDCVQEAAGSTSTG